MHEMNPQVLSILEQTQSLLKDPSKFTSDWFAKDEQNQSVNWTDPSAVKFDLLGAIYHFSENDKDRDGVLSELKILLPAGYNHIYQFSEKAGHQKILDLLSKAIDPTFKTAEELVAAELEAVELARLAAAKLIEESSAPSDVPNQNLSDSKDSDLPVKKKRGRPAKIKNP